MALPPMWGPIGSSVRRWIRADPWTTTATTLTGGARVSLAAATTAWMGSSGPWMGSAGLSRFFVFLIINRDGQHKVPAAVNGINRDGQHKVPTAVNGINHSRHLMLPAAVIPFSTAGTGVRHGEATINRDLSFVADTNARCGKCKVPVTVNSCVVVPVRGLRITFPISDGT